MIKNLSFPIIAFYIVTLFAFTNSAQATLKERNYKKDPKLDRSHIESINSEIGLSQSLKDEFEDPELYTKIWEKKENSHIEDKLKNCITEIRDKKEEIYDRLVSYRNRIHNPSTSWSYVPEPLFILLLCAGLVGLAVLARKKIVIK